MDKNLLQIQTIKQSNILDQKSFNELALLSEELKATFETVQIFRTRTEMEVSVLNNLKHPTPASKYWQSVREQNVMFGELASASYEYRIEVVKAKMLARKHNKEKDQLKRELLKIKFEQKCYLLKNMQRVAKDRLRELKEWSEIKKREAAFMDKGDLDNVDNHQLISYTRRWINQTIEMGNNGSPSERQNLLGQLNSGIKLCIKNGIIMNVLEGYNKNIQEKIMLEYGVM